MLRKSTMLALTAVAALGLAMTNASAKPGGPGFGKAKSVIFIYLQGGPSHIDLFDPKPLLEKYDGQKFPGEIKYDNAAEASSKVFASPFKFEKRGQSGIEISELLPHFHEIIDEVTLIRSMKTGVNNHLESMLAMHSGTFRGGRPTLGSWATR